MRNRGGGILKRSWRLARSAAFKGVIAKRVYTPLSTSHLQDILLPARGEHEAKAEAAKNSFTK